MPERAGAYLGFDFGLKRIGVALGQPLLGSARPLLVLNATANSLHEDIRRLVEEWQPRALVVGLPLDLEGNDTDMSRQARRFAGRLHGESGLDVYLQDERYSSIAADRQFAERRQQGLARQSQAQGKDAIAASVMLETWMADLPHNRPAFSSQAETRNAPDNNETPD